MKLLDQELIDKAFERMEMIEAVDLLIEVSKTQIMDEINGIIRRHKMERWWLGDYDVEVVYPKIPFREWRSSVDRIKPDGFNFNNL